MESFKNDNLLFPKSLYGTAAEVRPKWRKIARRVIQCGDWKAAISDVEFVAVEDYPGEIMLERSTYGPPERAKEPHWRVYVAAQFETVYQTPTKKCDDNCRARLILKGMEFFWFTVAMLGCEDGHFPNHYRIADPTLRETFYAEVASRFVVWLDRLALLDDRYSSEDFSASYLMSRWGRGHWLVPRIFRLIESTVGKESWRDGLCNQIEEGIAWLISKGFVKRTDQGVRICTPGEMD